MRLLTLITILCLPIITLGQIPCNCPINYSNKQNKADKVYRFKNGSTIGLCGFTEDNGATYSEFSLFDCSTNKIIEEWDATRTCKVDFRNDTLIIHELHMLPVAKNFSYKPVAIDIEKIYFSKNKLTKTTQLLHQIPVYSSIQINEVLKKAEDLSKLKAMGYNDSIVNISDMLLWSYISGSAKAEKLIHQIEKISGPFDGAIAEEWNDIWMLYLYYKEKSGNAKKIK